MPKPLGLAEYFAGDEPICVVLGDNIIENNICDAVENFQKQKEGAKILLKEVTDAQRFGVAEVRGDRVLGIEEKPKNPKSNYAVIGIYLYDTTVFQKIRRLKPSGRGELEITDVNNFYIEEGTLTYEVLDGWWTDAGTFESLLRANNLVAETGANKMPLATRRYAIAAGSRAMKIFVTGGAGFIGSNFIRHVLSLDKGYRDRQLRQADVRGEPRKPRRCCGQPELLVCQGRHLRCRRRGGGHARLRRRRCILPRNRTWTAASTSPRR